MTRIRALALVVIGVLLLETAAILGLVAVNANEAALSLGLIVPLALASYVSSCVVMHYSASGRRHHR
jgi:hypothetical protein